MLSQALVHQGKTLVVTLFILRFDQLNAAHVNSVSPTTQVSSRRLDYLLLIPRINLIEPTTNEVEFEE